MPESRGEKITTLLKKHGLSKITVEQDILQGFDVFSLYALRP